MPGAFATLITSTIWREIGCRIAPVLLIVVYAIVVVLWPSQLDDVFELLLASFPAVLLTIIVPSVFFALVHYSYIANRSPSVSWSDKLLIVLPQVLLGLTCLRALPGSHLIGPLFASAVTLTLLLATPFAKRGARALYGSMGATGALYLVCLALTLTSNAWFAQTIGAMGIIVLALGFYSVALLALQLDRRVGWVVVCVVLLALFLNKPQQDVSRLPKLPPEQSANVPFAKALSDWLGQRVDLPDYRDHRRPYPVVVVSAAGGGIVAAAHAYAALAEFSAYCPSFAQHLFVATGVSGGSFGLALFAAEAEKRAGTPKSLACAQTHAPLDTKDLTADHLSPILSVLLFSGVPDFLMPGRPLKSDLARALEESFATSDFLRTDQALAWTPASTAPALSFVATDLRQGKRFVFAPFVPNYSLTDGQYFSRQDEANAGGISVAAAAGASARFPWITPTGRLDLGPTDRTVLPGGTYHIADDARILADGGYFDDSGAVTALEMYRQVEDSAKLTEDCIEGTAYCPKFFADRQNRECRIIVEREFTARVDWKGCDDHIFLVMLTIAPTYGVSTDFLKHGDPAEDQSWLLDPVSTMLAVRSAKGELALSALSRTLGDRHGAAGYALDAGYPVLRLPTDIMAPLPLGWLLAPSHLQEILDQVVLHVPCDSWDLYDGNDPQLLRKKELHDAGVSYSCQLEQITPLFDLSRDPTTGFYFPAFDPNEALPNVYRPPYSSDPFGPERMYLPMLAPSGEPAR